MPPGGLARVLDALRASGGSPTATRRRASAPGTATSASTPNSEPGEGADRDVVERVDRQREQRLRRRTARARAAPTTRARACTARACAGAGRPAGRRTSSRSTARRARRAIVFAHTIVESPKNGAIRRAAAISAPSVAMPTTKTSNSSGQPRRRRARSRRGRFLRSTVADTPSSMAASRDGPFCSVAERSVPLAGRRPTPGSVPRNGHRRPRRRSTAPTSGTRSRSSAAGSRRRR